MSPPRAKRQQLAERVRARRLVVAPGVFDMISLKVADHQGHAALYMTGYGTVASLLGLPDAGLATYTDMVSRAALMAAGSSAPLIADADTGYGGLLNVRHTVQGYEAAGVAAIQLEDQEFPKKCGHTPGRAVIPQEDMVAKIQVAVEARQDPDFLIIARTDARTSLGIDAAIARALAYQKAGADVIFVEAPESADEFEQIAQEVDAPLLANMVDGGRSPVLESAMLERLGYAIAIYPGLGFMAAAASMDRVYRYLLDHGTSNGADVALHPIEAMHELMGFQEVWSFDERWKN